MCIYLKLFELTNTYSRIPEENVLNHETIIKNLNKNFDNTIKNYEIEINTHLPQELNDIVIKYCKYETFISTIKENKICGHKLFGKKVGVWFISIKPYSHTKDDIEYIQFKMEFKNNLLDGSFLAYFDFYKRTKLLNCTGQYENGLKTGIWKFYDSMNQTYFMDDFNCDENSNDGWDFTVKYNNGLAYDSNEVSGWNIEIFEKIMHELE